MRCIIISWLRIIPRLRPRQDTKERGDASFLDIGGGRFLIAAAGHAIAGPFPPAGLTGPEAGAPVILVQDKKNESLKQKVKRVWRNIAGYHFDVSCPLRARSTCADTGKDRGEAQAKCISRNPLCWVSDSK